MKKMLRSLLSLALCLVLATALTLPASAESLENFTDADVVDYDEAVEVLTGLGILDGVEAAGQSSGGTFTRAAAATLIARFRLGREAADALPAPATAPFSDVGVDDPYAAAIAYCKEQGIIDGHGDGSFDPNGTATGYALAKMLLTALGYGSGPECFTGPGWETNVGNLAKSTGLVRDDSTSLGQPIAEEMQEELEIIPASFGATAATLLAAAEMPRVEYADVEAPKPAVASTTVYTVSVTDGATDDAGTAASLSKLISSDRLTVTRAIPAEAFDAPSLGGAQYVVADGAATMPEGKAVGFRENDNAKTLYLSDEDAQALLALVQNITPEQFAQFSSMFAGSATYPDGTTTGDDPTEWLKDFTAEQGLVDMFVGFVGDSLTAPVQVGANIYYPVTGTVTNAYTDEQTVVADAVKYAAEAATLPEADLSGDMLIGTRDGVPQYADITSEAVAIPLERGFDGLKVESGGRDPFGRPQTVYRSGDATETVTRKPNLTYTGEVGYDWLREDITAWLSLDAFADIDYYVDGVLTEGVITADRILYSGNPIRTTGKGSLTEVYFEKVDENGAITKMTVVTVNTNYAEVANYAASPTDPDTLYINAYLDGDTPTRLTISEDDCDISAFADSAAGDELLITLTYTDGVTAVRSVERAETREAALEGTTAVGLTYDGETYGVAKNAVGAPASVGEKQTITLDGYGNIIHFAPVEENFTLRHIAVATLRAGDDGSAKISGREITDADLEIKKNGDISLINTYTDYLWVSGLEIPAAATWTRIGAAPAQITETLTVDADGNTTTEQSLTALGTLPTDAERSTGGTTFFEDVGGNTAGWIYVFTLCYDEDGNLSRVYQFDEPIAYPLGTSSGGTSTTTGCCGGNKAICTCDHYPDSMEFGVICDHPDCWCYDEFGEEIEE